MRRILLTSLWSLICMPCFCWGFYGHRQINFFAVFLLPPEMTGFYKKHIGFLAEHAVDPDKRRYAVTAEAPRHYIDIDQYGEAPYDSLPRTWNAATARFSADTLNAHGIVPWWIQVMLARLTAAFREKDQARILKYSAELGHYIADSHVPLHTTRNHNGQYTGQKGIHGFWESRVPELLAEKEWDFFIGHAGYISDPLTYTWERVLESTAAVDSVLRTDRQLSASFRSDQLYAYEDRNGITTRQYSSAYTIAYNEKLNGMVERRMRQAIYSVASFWFTAWVNAGQPDLATLSNMIVPTGNLKDLEQLNLAWKDAPGQQHDH